MGWDLLEERKLLYPFIAEFEFIFQRYKNTSQNQYIFVLFLSGAEYSSLFYNDNKIHHKIITFVAFFLRKSVLEVWVDAG